MLRNKRLSHTVTCFYIAAGDSSSEYLHVWLGSITIALRENKGVYTRYKILLHAILNLNSINQLMFVMVKFGVLFEVRPGFLNNI
jgi:hypothetical protein